eukprot:SAG11_NODE_4304_length_1959_cov_1.436559_2_plen_43_part_01
MPPAGSGVETMGGCEATPVQGCFDRAGTVLTFCGHPDYSHRPA